jgi:TolB-like protein
MKHSDAPERLQLGGFVLDLGSGELLGADGRPAALRRQALAMLLELGRRAGQVVGKDDLMDLVWRHVVVGEGSLTQAVADIRRALDDTDHRLVRNVARRGYMLVPDVGTDAPVLAVVVMPLALEGAVNDDEWFADALHGDLIDEVALIPGSWVIARSTAATYKGRSIDPRLVARELRVRHVVQGSVRHEGAQIRLKLALINGEDGVQRWAETFMVERARLPQALADFALRVTRVLAPALIRSVVEQRAALSPLEVSADDLAMRAIAVWYRGINAQNLVEVLQLQERAVALDEQCVRAWGGLCITLVQGLANGWLSDREGSKRRIDEASAQLQRLDADGVQAHIARVIQSFLREDWPAMLRLTHAFTERHRSPAAFNARGMALLITGQPDAAVAALETSLRWSPRDPMVAEVQYRLAMAHFVAGRYELACEWGQTAALANPRLPWPPVHAAALHRLGQQGEARAAYADHIARHPDFGSASVLQRLPGSNPVFAQARDKLVESLMALGGN